MCVEQPTPAIDYSSFRPSTLLRIGTLKPKTLDGLGTEQQMVKTPDSLKIPHLDLVRCETGSDRYRYRSEYVLSEYEVVSMCAYSEPADNSFCYGI